jgi:peptide/nickel transport system permease protein
LKASRRSAVLGAVLVALNVLVALGAPLIAGVDPQALDVKARLARPTGEHWFGTDHVGRDAWSRVIHGARLSSAHEEAMAAESATIRARHVR